MQKRQPKRFQSWLFTGAVFLALAACQTAPTIGAAVDPLRLKDGVYDGTFSNWPNGAKVRVTIAGGKIEAVEVLRHFSSWKGWKVNAVIPERIVATQSTQVDVVSGATNSSIVVMNAAHKALEKAYE